MDLPDHIPASKYSTVYRDEISRRETCGYFCCLATSCPHEVEGWVDDQDGVGQTTLCPYCTMDSVIGSESGFPINKVILAQMYQYWF